jgi:eukaryotic-like serine/threonine-protein kinase
MDKIGKYNLLRVLGEGATSTVYLSFDPATGRDLAVKVAKPQAMQDPNLGFYYRKTFETEAALAGKLDHPYIVAIHDAVYGEEVSYIVMELVEGGTLEKYCDPDNLLPNARLVDILYACTIALDFTQRGGIIHRDIKPANILLVGPSEDVKISDFGGAVVPGIVPLQGVGSPAYMSPEQAQQAPLDYRTDMYSLGAVMYRMLTGRLPFPGKDTTEMLDRVVNAQMQPPSDFRLEVTQKLEDVVMKAMAKKPDARFKNWTSFGAALQSAV